jgi:hypothetical protein
VDPTANLYSLHRHEEELRARSLEAIKNDPTYQLIRLRLDRPGTVVRIRWKPANFEDLVLALLKTGLNRLQALGRSAIVTERARSSVA